MCWANAARPYFILMALAVGAAFYFGWTFVSWLPQASEETFKVNPRLGTILGTLAAALVWVANWVARGCRSDWMRVATPDFPADALAINPFAPKVGFVLVCTLIGVLMSGLQLWVTGDLSVSRVSTAPQLLGAMLIITLFWILAVQVGGFFVAVILGFYRLGRHVEPDLLRLDALSPFSYVGLRVLAALAVNIALLLIMSRDIGPSGKLDLVGLSVPCGFMLLQIGVRKSIRRVRRRMLKQLDEHLDAVGFPDKSSLQSTSSVQRVAELASLRERLTRAPDWPVTGIVWLRFTALLLVPAATWALEKLITRL